MEPLGSKKKNDKNEHSSASIDNKQHKIIVGLMARAPEL